MELMIRINKYIERKKVRKKNEKNEKNKCFSFIAVIII